MTAPRPVGRRARITNCFSAGKTHFLTRVGRYDLCVTPNQRRVLFDDTNPQKIGCGVFGCAFIYPKDNSKVVKITVDREDASALVAAQDVPHVVRIFDAWKLIQPVRAKGQKLDPRAWSESGWKTRPGETFPAFAMVVERLRPVPKEDRRWMGRVLSVVRYARGAPNPDDLLAACPKDKAKRKRCHFFAAELADTTADFQDRDIEWNDAHIGNIGIAEDGQWKVLDLGLTKHRWNEPTDVLQGGRRRWRKVARRFVRVR